MENYICHWGLTVLALVLVVSGSEGHLSPLGINFGPTYITAAAQSSDQGYQASCPATGAQWRVLGSFAYQKYMADAILNTNGTVQISTSGQSKPSPPRAYSYKETQNIFKEAFDAITAEVNYRIKSPFTVGVVSYPQYLNQSSLRAWKQAARESKGSFAQPWRFMANLEVAIQSYGFTSCAGFGLTKEECDYDNGSHAVIFLDYNHGTLDMTLAAVSGNKVAPQSHMRMSNLYVADPRNEGPGVFAQEEMLLYGLRDFLSTLLSDSPLLVQDMDMSALIVMGDAEHEEMMNLTTLLRAVTLAACIEYPELGNETCDWLVELVKYQILPGGVAAWGAASRASVFSEYPKVSDGSVVFAFR